MVGQVSGCLKRIRNGPSGVRARVQDGEIPSLVGPGILAADGPVSPIVPRQPALSLEVVQTGDVTREPAEKIQPHSGLNDVLDLAAVLIAGSLLILIYLGQSGIPRILLAVGFAFFVPGRAIVSNWRRMRAWSEVAMPMVLSLSLLTFLAMITLWAHAWRPMGLFQGEAWLSMAGVCAGVARRNRRKPHPRPYGLDHGDACND